MLMMGLSQSYGFGRRSSKMQNAWLMWQILIVASKPTPIKTRSLDDEGYLKKISRDFEKRFDLRYGKIIL